MSCPECEGMLREYMIFRGAVARFGKILEQLEVERQRIHEEQRPPGATPLRHFAVSIKPASEQG